MNQSKHGLANELKNHKYWFTSEKPTQDFSGLSSFEGFLKPEIQASNA
ncbi:hypothetical protein ACROAH_15360 [Shewanella oncorhynchi]